MPILNRSQCLLCGCRNKLGMTQDNISDHHVNTSSSNTCAARTDANHSIILQWKYQCSQTVCKILFGSATHPLCDCFQWAEYCVSCEQEVRDINFTWRQIKSFQRKLDQLTMTIKDKLHNNYLSIQQQKDLANTSTSESPTSEYRLEDLWNSKSYGEIIEIMHEDLRKFSNQDVSPNKLDSVETNPYFHSNFQLETIKIETPDAIENDCLDEATSSFCSNLSTNQDTADTEEKQGQLGQKRKLRTTRQNIKTKPKYFKTECSSDEPSDHSDEYNVNEEERASEEREVQSHTSKSRNNCEKNSNARRKISKSGNRERKRKLEGSKLINCTEKDCELKFKTLTKLELHVRQFHKGEARVHQCSNCSKSFKWRKTLLQHIRDFHEGPRSSLNYACKYCGKSYSNEEDLNSHYADSHLGPNPFSCGFCPSVFSNSIDLRSHMKNAHTESEIYKFKCEICNIPFSSKGGYQKHNKLHGNPDLLHKCNICSRVFASKSWLNTHLTRHNQSREYVCEVCGKAFKTRMSLEAHSIRHTGKKQFKCKICGKGFVTNIAVKRHEISHTGIKAYICQKCGRSFVSSFNLKEHETKVCKDKRNLPQKKSRKNQFNVDVSNNQQDMEGLFGL